MLNKKITFYVIINNTLEFELLILNFKLKPKS